MTTIKIPPPASGGLMLSYKCTAACRHCMYACSPHWPADWISEQDLTTGLAQLARTIQPALWGPNTIGLSDGLHFSGGEPFLNFALLLRAVEIAAGFGIPSMFVETNGYWCRNDDVTRDRLQTLRDAGLAGILISVNPFYAEYVPFERTERCIRHSLAVFGPDNVAVYQAEYYRRFRQLGIRDRISVEDYLARSSERSLSGRVEMFLMGRACSSLRHLYPSYPAHTFFGQPCQPPFLRDWHNHFDNYGHFMPGFCGGISLGSWLQLDRLLEEGIDLDQRPILAFLVAGDMRGLFAFARDRGYQPAAAGYLSKCDLCLDVRRHLVTVDDYPELQPRQYYTHLSR
jgi:hypothetical protein